MLCVCIETLVWLLAQRAVLVVGLSLSFIESLSSHANELTPGRGVRSASALCLSSTSSPPPLSLHPLVVAKQPRGSSRMNAKLCDSPSTKTVQLCAACCMRERQRGIEGGKQRGQRVCCVLAYLPRLAVACQASKLAVSDKDNIMAAAAVAVAVAQAEP